MGELSEAVAGEMGISREEQDTFAADSHNKAEAAVKAGRFAEEIVAVALPARGGRSESFKDEEIFREGVTPESLAKLKPVFSKDGTGVDVAGALLDDDPGRLAQGAAGVDDII